MKLGVRNLFKPLVCLLVASSVASATTLPKVAGMPAAEDSIPEIQQVYDNAQTNNMMAEWLDTRFNDSIKDGLDKSVDQILRMHPVVQQILPDVRYMLRREAGTQRALFLGYTGRAMEAQAGQNNGQYAHLLQMVREIALKLNFPKAARDDAHVSVMATNDINAFTFAPYPALIDVVVFQGLMDLLTEGQLKAVLGHEVGHIKAKHVLNQTLVIMMFLYAGEVLIPSPDQLNDWRTSAAARRLRTEVRRATRMMAGHGYRRALPRGIRDTLADGMIRSAEEGVNKLREFGAKNPEFRNQIVALASQLGQSLRTNANVSERAAALRGLNPTTTTQANANAQAGLTMQDLIEFIRLLNAYSRSCEVSSDRYGLIVTNVEDAQNVDVRLAGGRGANIEALRRQREQILQIFTDFPDKRPEFIDAQQTHPAPIFRALQYENFMRSLPYQIASNSLLQASDDYLAVARDVEELDVPLRGRATPGELISTSEHQNRRDQFAEFEHSLSSALVNAIMTQFRAQPRISISRFESMARYLRDARKRGENIPLRATEEGGLLFELAQGLRGLPEDAVVRKALEILDSLAPPVWPGRRDESGNSFERRLAELRLLVGEQPAAPTPDTGTSNSCAVALKTE